MVGFALVLLCGYVGIGVAQMTATSGQKLSDAIGKLQGKGGQLFFPCGRYEADNTVNVQANGVYLRGSGYCSQIVVTTSRDLFNVTGELFVLEGFEIVVDATADRSGAAMVRGNGTQGLISHVRFSGSYKLGNNGYVYYANSPQGGGWFFEDIRMTGGTTWRAFLSLSSATGKTVASTWVTTTGGGVSFTDAAFDLNGAIDTLQIAQTDFSLRGGRVFWLRNTVGAPIAPRWVMCSNCVIETRGSTAIQLDASRDFSYHGCIAGADLAVYVGKGAADTDISNTIIVSTMKGGITIDAGAVNTLVKDNFFEDTSNGGANAYDTITVESGATDFQIAGNMWRSTNNYKARYAINLSGASNSYRVVNNQIPANAYSSGATRNVGGGANFVVSGNSGTPDKSSVK